MLINFRIILYTVPIAYGESIWFMQETLFNYKTFTIAILEDTNSYEHAQALAP